MNFEHKGKWLKQISEAKLQDKYVLFDTSDTGLTVLFDVDDNGNIEIELTDALNQNKPRFIKKTDLDGLKQLDEAEKLRKSIAKDIKSIADKFDKDVLAILSKYGFKKK